MRNSFGLGLALAAALGCNALLALEDEPNSPDERQVGAGESSSGSSGSSSSKSSGANPSSSSSGEPARPTTYAEAQTALAALRSQGPLTVQGSAGQCTDSYFVWRDADGTLHSWSGLTQETIDYAFKAGPRPFFRASDRYLGVDVAGFDAIAVYRTEEANAFVGDIEYASAWSATNDGMLRVESPSSTTRVVRKWTPSSNDLVSSVLTTEQPPLAFGADTLVLAAGVTAPYPLYLVDANGGASSSVVFDGSTGLHFAMPTPRGLFVSYARNGGSSALRWYRNDSDTDRLELGDELATLPLVFADSFAGEHAFVARTAFAGDSTLFYDSAFGIWAYDIDAGTLSPVQLGADHQRLLVDTLCVLPRAGLLVYREMNDATGRIWTLPLEQL